MRNFIDAFKVSENSQFPDPAYFQRLSQDLSKDPRVRILPAGKSRKGHELNAFAIGTGEKVIGVTSGAHADEPIGVLTQTYFIKGLLENPAFEQLLKDYTFLCHPLVDPDGYILNSKWFSNPLTFTDYWLHNFRNNSPSEDCEHGIPFQEGQAGRPEMVYVKSNLDQYKGRFEYYVTLHSSHILPGACFVFDRDHNDVVLRDRIAGLCENYSLPLMDYKSQSDDTMTYLGPGFIGSPTVQTMMDHFKDQPEILKQIKMTTYEYAQTHCGAKSAFISELPLWLSQGMDDYADSDMTMNEFKEIHHRHSKSYLQSLKEVEATVSQFNPKEENLWYKSLKTSITRGTSALQAEETKLGSYKGFAQGLEVKELEHQDLEYKCKVLKTAIKSLEGTNGAEALIEKYQAQFKEAISTHEKNLNLKQLSIKTQVEIQIGLVLSGIPNLD